MSGEAILALPECAAVRESYARWRDFMDREVEFHLPGSALRTREHCARVLLHALRLAEAHGLSARERDILAMAACFHDTRRQNDWLDTGHGQRAAEYYRAFCAENPLPWEETCYQIMAFHDRDDALGLEALGAVEEPEGNAPLLYQIFKDADALDRFRLGPGGLDRNSLRTRAAGQMCAFAERACAQWT